MAEYLHEIRKYLNAFFIAKYQEYTQTMNEYRPERGYGYYYKCNEVTQAIRNIVHNITDTFGEMRIPEKFSSPQHLLVTLSNFQRMLQNQNDLLLDVFKYYQGDNIIPTPALEISRVNNEVLDAVTFALSFDEAKQYLSASNAHSIDEQEAIDLVKKTLERFNLVARQLTRRRCNGGVPRETLIISDEYDVQDLLHSLLRIFFDDIRPEEWTPSYAGGSSRIDFLIKRYGIIIEVKKTRESLLDKEVGEQLIIDIAKYRSHPDCKHLICFIFDPDRYLKNPVGIIEDLESKEKKLQVIIVPRL